ncbi:MAG: DUF6081 family protein [Actinomycetota bacterium]|nr:DUF6081 family protein [Actinomycetota bacterium]
MSIDEKQVQGTHSSQAARQGWDIYDEFEGPNLDASLWQPADFGSGPRLEPEARTTVEDGALTVDVQRFSNCDPNNQGLDNTKHLVISTKGFAIPADGARRFSVDLHAENFDASGDYRHGFATLTLVDFTTHTVLGIFSTGDRVFAEQEILESPGQEHPFTRVVEDPFFASRAGLTPGPGYVRCEIEIDRTHGQITYRIDDRVLHVAAGVTGLPEEVHMAFGMFTLLPVEEGSSCRGQGGRASWRNFQSSAPPEDSA